MKRALFALLVLLAAAESSAQGDFVVNYRGLMAGRALVTNGFVDFYRTDTAYRVRLQGPTGLAANRTFTLPPNLGSSGQALTTDGAGAMSWASFLESSAIGSTVQAYDADLAALAGLSTSANQCSYWTGAGAAALTSCTAAGRSMIGAADAAAQTALLSAFTGDSGAGGVKGLVPAPSSGDSGKFLKGDGTWGAAASGITHNSTTTNSCAAGGIVRSTSNLADCGAGLTYASGTLTTSGDFVLGASGSAATLRFVNSNQYLLTNVGDGSMELGGGGLTIRSSLNTRVPLLVKPGVSGGTANIQNWADYSGNIFHSVASTGAFSIGSSSLGSTVVPLTARLGTGSTANVFEMQNSAGTNMSYFKANGGLHLPIGSAGSPSLTLGNFTGRGFYDDGSGSWTYYAGGNVLQLVAQSTLHMASGGTLGWDTGATVGYGLRGSLSSESLGVYQWGVDAAVAVNQTLKAHDGVGTDISGADLTIAAGRGTGTGAGGVLKFQTAPVEASGTTAQTLVDRLTIGKSGTVTIGTLASGANVTALAVNAPNSSSGSPSQWPFYVQVQSGRYFSTWAEGAGTNSGGFSITTGSPAGMNFWWNPQAGGTANIAFNRTVGSAATVTGPQITMNASSLDLQVSDGSALYTGFNMASTGAVTLGGSTITGTTVAATINNGTSTGNILNVQDNGNTVLAVQDGGIVQLNRYGGSSDYGYLQLGTGITTLQASGSGVTSALGKITTNVNNAYTFLPNFAFENTSGVLATLGGNQAMKIGGAAGMSATAVGLVVDNYNSTGNILNLQDNGTNVFTVADGGLVTLAGNLTVNGATTSLGVKLTTGTKPTCDSTTRGTQFYVAGGAGVADTMEVCAKSSLDAYAWYPMATIP